jgi:hypothetical protein
MGPWKLTGAQALTAVLALAVLALTVLALAGPALAQVSPMQSRVTGLQALPNSVILTGAPPTATVQRLRVVRQFSLAEIRSNPQMTLGAARIDFTPLLSNPRSSYALASRLRTLPQHVQIAQDEVQISQIDQGLIMHHVLSYAILPGRCADPVARRQISAAGAQCFTRATAAERIAAFAAPGSPRYVADPAKRQIAIAAFQRNSALQDADATRRIADLRAALNNPAQRGQIAAQVGPQEMQRLTTLNDDQLKEEVINAATQRFEETTFTPQLESSKYAHPTSTLRPAPGAAEIAAGQQLINGQGAAQAPAAYPKLLRSIPGTGFRTTGSSTTPTGDQTSDLDLGTFVFLTGFTLGHDYEWNLEVDTTINWCVIGCSSTYSVKLYAGFNYGFGLRFPIQTNLKYHNVTHPNNTAQATLTATYAPIEGSVQDFQATGLSSDQLFGGKELVAQVGADAGFNYNLPVLGGGGTGVSVGVDFTDLLPAPYTHGTFLPPAPGQHGVDTPYVFDTIDLLGGLLNFGVLGGQVFPAIDINLHSNKLQFTVNDEIGNRRTLVNATGQPVSVGVNPAKGDDSHFSFGNPVYNLGFTLTPGIDARLFIDVAVWSNNWDWPVWFPQLAVDLPPGGMDFSCHAGTTCVLDFEPEHQAGLTNGVMQTLKNLGCVQQGSAMSCTKLTGYAACQTAVNSHSILGVQSCDGSFALREEQVADRTLTGGGCLRQGGQIGRYACAIKGGMLGLCMTMANNGSVLSCQALVPPQVDQILRRGCSESPNQAGVFTCIPGMLALCNTYAKNGYVLMCKVGP